MIHLRSQNQACLWLISSPQGFIFRAKKFPSLYLSIKYLNMHRSRLLHLSIKQLLQLQYICWTLTERAMTEDTDLCRRISFKCCCKLKPVTKRSDCFWMMLTDWQHHCRMVKQKWNPKSVQKLFWLFALTAHLPQIPPRGFDILGSPCAGENKEMPTFKLSPQLLLFRVFGFVFCLGFLILHSSLPGAFVCKDEKKSIFLKMSASLRHWNQKMGKEEQPISTKNAAIAFWQRRGEWRMLG